jgi:hypothetical protein
MTDLERGVDGLIEDEYLFEVLDLARGSTTRQPGRQHERDDHTDRRDCERVVVSGLGLVGVGFPPALVATTDAAGHQLDDRLSSTSMTVYDPVSEEFRADRVRVYRRLRDEAPVYLQPNGRFAALSRFEDVRAAALDWQTYSAVTAEGTWRCAT